MADIWSLEQQKRALEHKNRELSLEKKEYESLISELGILVSDHLACWKQNQNAFAGNAGLNGDNRCIKSFLAKIQAELGSGTSRSVSSHMSSLHNSVSREMQRIYNKIDDNNYQIRICEAKIKAARRAQAASDNEKGD